MANVNLQRTSWGYGELDTRMLGRTDLPTYRQGLVKMENWLPAKSGAAVMRGGMEQVKSIPPTFEADCIIPLRGGESPMLGLYNSTDQTFRVMKADGTWVGVTDAAPAEVTLFNSITFQHDPAQDTSEFYQYDPILPVNYASVQAAIDAFYDLIASYETMPNASCFKIRLGVSVASFRQDFSLAGGTVVLDRGTVADSQVLTLTPKTPRPETALIDRAITGAIPTDAYIDKVILRRTANTSGEAVELHIEDTTTGVGVRVDIANYETQSGTVEVLFNDDPGVIPMWTVEPNVAYDEVVVRLFRPNSDVKVYKITDTTITEDLHDATAADHVGAVVGGKHSAHGAYFEQRIVYGGGRDHRQEIVGSRSPDPLSGNRRYGGWSLSDQTTTSVETTDVQLFYPAAVDYDAAIWGGGYIAMSPAATTARQQVDTAFTFNGAIRYFSQLSLGNNSNYGLGEPIFQMSFGSGDTIANESSGGAAPNNGIGTDVTGYSNLSDNFELNGRITVIHGDDELEINLSPRPTDAESPNADSPTLSEARPYRRVTDLYPLALLHVGASFYGLHKYDNSDDLAAKLFSSEATRIQEFVQKMLAMEPRPEASSYTIKFELGDTRSESTTTVNSDNAFKWVIDTGTTFAEVRWLQAFSGVLAVGTSAGIAICKFLNPDDPPEIRWHSSQCVARKPPLATSLGVLAVSADKTAIYEVIRKRDLTAYSEDRFRQDKILTMAWQQQPIQRLWVVTEAGVIHVLTIQDENGVNGWAQITHQHSGTCTGVVVTSGDDEDDTVWFLMKYGAQSYVEKYHEAKNNLHSNRLFMDSAVKRTVGKQTIAVQNYLEAGRAYGDPNDALGAGATSHRGFITLAMVITDGGADVVDQKVSSIFTGDPAQNRYLGSIIMFDTETDTASRGSGGGNEHAGVVTQGYGGSFEEEFMAAIDFDGAMSADFITNGSITVTHTAPLSGTIDTVTFKMAGAVHEVGDPAVPGNPYLLTDADLTTNGDKANFTAFCNKIRSAAGYYPDAVSVAGSVNFTVELSIDTPKVAIPLNMVGVTGKKLCITSAAPGGAVAEIAKYEIIDSPAAPATEETFVETNFNYGDEVWVGFQVIGDMELPAIERSISSHAAGSWLGQPARVPWVVSGVEKAHSVKIGPTYAKLVEYFAATTTLSVTAALPEANTTEPYVYTPTNHAEVDVWVNAVKALHPVGTDVFGANLFTITIAIGATTQSMVCSGMDIGSASVTLYPTRNATNILTAPFLTGGTGTRYVAALIVTSTSHRITLQIAPDLTTAGSTADARLITGFETGGSVAVTRTANAALTTGHERRDMPDHVTTTEPVVIRKDTPSPCTMTYLVVEATAG